MSSKKNDSRKTIIVVGGGFAGIKIASGFSKTLSSKDYDIILIDARPYHVLLPASIRLVVSEKDKLEASALVPFDRIFVNGNGKYIQGNVVSVHQEPGATEGTLALENGEELAYHVLVVCTGAQWKGLIGFPLGPVEDFINEKRNQVAKARDIVLVGGGSVAIETAGEILDLWPEKSITIVHGGTQLLSNSYPDKVRLIAATAMKSRGVKLLLGDKLDPDAQGPVTTSNGVSLTPDLIINTSGTKPNTSLLASLGSDVLTPYGFVRIKPTLQLSQYPNIFAAGDIMDWDEQKQAGKTMWHASIVLNNIKVYFDGIGKMTEYSKAREMIIITNGRNGGFGYLQILWGITLGNFFARLIKSKSLMIAMMRKECGY